MEISYYWKLCQATKISKLAIFKGAFFWKIHNFWGFWGKVSRYLDIMTVVWYANIRVIKFKRRNWVCKIRFQNHHPHLFLTFADLSGAPKVTIMGKDRQMKKNNRPIFARAASWIFKRRIALSLNGVTRLYTFFIRKGPVQLNSQTAKC